MLLIPAFQFFAPLVGGLVAGNLEGQGKAVGKSLVYQIGVQWAKGAFILGALIRRLLLVFITQGSRQADL